MSQLAHDIMIRTAGADAPATVEIDGVEFPFCISPDVSAGFDAHAPIQRLTVDIFFDGNLSFRSAA